MYRNESFKKKKVVRAFSEGFQDDPLYVSVIENPRDRAIFLKGFMKSYLYMSQHTCYMWSDNSVHAMLFDPGKKVSNFHLYLSFYIGLLKGWRAYKLLGYKKYRRVVNELVIEGSDWLDDFDNYIHLDMIVVDANNRGQGIGKDMIGKVIAYAHSLGKDVTLETQSKVNRDLYEHMGFVLYKNLKFDKYTEYCMIHKHLDMIHKHLE